MDTLLRFFEWILDTSARASLLTLVVLMIQLALRHRVPARWRHALWLPVLIVLLMPVFPGSSWSVHSITHITAAPALQPKSAAVERNAAVPATSNLGLAPQTAGPVPWKQILCITWLAGAAGMVLFGSAALMLTMKRCQRSRVVASDALHRELTVLAREIGLRQAPCLLVASAVRSPAVAGLFRSTLLLPSIFEQTLTPQEVRHVLKHELMHIKRGDLPVHALLCLLLALHWFNPLLWLAFFRARLDREAACDAQVLQRENQAERVAYGHTLLNAESVFGHHGLTLGFVGIFQHGSALRARIRSIASPPNSHPLMKTALTLGIALLTFLGVTKAAMPDPKAPQVYIVARFIELTEKEPAPPGGSGKPLPAPLEAGKSEPGLLGIFTDPQFQVLIRDLSQRKGVDLMSTPSVTARNGQQARVEVVREFIYPADLDLPPAAKKAIEADVGVTLEVKPTITAENQIALDLASQVVEFEGFEATKNDRDEQPLLVRKLLHPDGTYTESTSDGEKGEVRESKFDARGVLLTRKTVPSSKGKESTQPNPIFNKRRTRVNAVLSSGHTMVVKMESRTDKQTVEEADEEGRVISSGVDLFHRRLFVFVTATLIDPATGKPLAP